MKNKFKDLKEGQFIIINGKTLCVSEDATILQSFFATDSDGDEQEYHESQVDAICP